MRKPALLVLVRHGESEMNVAKGSNIYIPEDKVESIRGIPDHEISLTPRGLKQAVATGVALRKLYGVFDVIYDTNYRRTIQTRDAILKAYTPKEAAMMKLRHSDLIRERERGYTFNMTTEQVNRYFPYLQEYYDTFGPFYTTPPGGKSLVDHCKWVADFIQIMNNIRAGQKVCVIDHGHTHRAFRYNIEHWTPEQYIASARNDEPYKNCGIIAYRFSREKDKLELEALNKTYW